MFDWKVQVNCMVTELCIRRLDSFTILQYKGTLYTMLYSNENIGVEYGGLGGSSPPEICSDVSVTVVFLCPKRIRTRLLVAVVEELYLHAMKTKPIRNVEEIFKKTGNKRSLGYYTTMKRIEGFAAYARPQEMIICHYPLLQDKSRLPSVLLLMVLGSGKRHYRNIPLS